MKIIDYIFYKYYCIFRKFDIEHPVSTVTSIISLLLLWPFIIFAFNNELYVGISALILFVLLTVFYEKNDRFVQIVNQFDIKFINKKDVVGSIFFTFGNIVYIVANFILMLIVRSKNLNN